MGMKKVRLASESEFQQLFPDCELGAMPPFGNLYNLTTYVDQDVSLNENIVINAGTHAEAIRLRYGDFSRLARPRIIRFGEPPPVEIAAKKKAARKKARKAKKARPKKKAAGKGGKKKAAKKKGKKRR